MWGASSESESIAWRDWQTKGPTSGWGSSWERSSFDSWFSTFVFHNLPGTATEQVGTCGFRRNSSTIDKAHKTHDSVLLNSLENFFVTLPSISPETWEMYSWVCFVTDCSLCFQVLVSKLPIISSFFAKLPRIWEKNFVSCEDWKDFYFII